MKKSLIEKLKMIVPVVALVACAGGIARAQDTRLRTESLDRLEVTAVEFVNVNIDERMLRLAEKFLSAKKPKEALAKEMLSGIKGIYVKRFEFDKPNLYSAADVTGLRSQLQAPGWSRMVEVRSKREGQNVEVYTLMAGDRINGLAVIAFEPQALTVVNVVGFVDIEKLSALEGTFSIPELGITRGEKKTPKEK